MSITVIKYGKNADSDSKIGPKRTKKIYRIWAFTVWAGKKGGNVYQKWAFNRTFTVWMP